MIPLVPESFVSGGVLLIIFGAVLASLRRFPGQIWRFVERHMLVSLDVYDNDEAFHWIKIWLGEKLKDSKSKSTFTKRIDSNGDCPSPGGYDGDESDYKKINDFVGRDRRPQANFIPSPNLYFFKFKKTLCWVNYDRKEMEGNTTLQKARESFTVRCLSRKIDVLKEMVNEARDFACPNDKRIEIRTGTNHYWELMGRVDSRPTESVILPDGIMNSIIEDVRVFQNSKNWYAKLGIPYRRGILLYGEPGSGKSSLVLAVASEFGMNVNVLFLSDPNMTDAKLQELINKTDNNTIVLIEDIDSIFKKRKKATGAKLPLTFSGLLNAIDGLASQGGRILFMTTNKINEIDPALIRPGRADRRICISNADSKQAKTLFERFFPGVSGDKFGSLIPEGEISMASIQGHLLSYRENPEEAIEKVPLMIEEERKIREARNKKDE